MNLDINVNHDDVSEALRKARYNEVVHITIEQEEATISQLGSESKLKQQICLIPRLNALQGGIQFENLIDLIRNQRINESCTLLLSDQELFLQKELQTKQWFFPMLNDHQRNVLYFRAIASAVQYMTRKCEQTSQGKRCKSVLKILDIGSGSGLLSMMAARSCCEASPPIPVHIVSAEMSCSFSFMASQTVKENNFAEDIISIQHGQHSMSSTFNDGLHTSRFDLCISELLDDGLLGEGWIPSIRDAWKRHLSPNAVVVPSGAQVYACLVQAEWLPKYTGPLPFYYTCLNGSKGHIQIDPHSIPGNKQLIDAQHVVLPVHAEKLIRDGILNVLSNSMPVFSFDVSCPEAIPHPEGQSKNVSFSVSLPGAINDEDCSNSLVCVAHGVLVWWELNIWNGCMYSIAPGNGSWQDHWHPCLYVLDPAVTVTHNETLEILFHHDDYRISVSLAKKPHCQSSNFNEGCIQESKWVKRDDVSMNGSSKESSLKPALISPSRAFQLNDPNRLNVFQKALEYALLSQSQAEISNELEAAAGTWNRIIVLDISDFALGSLLVTSMIAANPNLCHSCKVLSLENSSGSIPMISASMYF